MGTCNVKEFFNEEHKSSMSRLFSKAYRAVNTKSKSFTKDFYQELINVLKSTDASFITEYDSTFSKTLRERYKRSLLLLGNTILNTINSVSAFNKVDRAEFANLITSNLQKDLGGTRLSPVLFNEVAEEEINDSQLSLRQFQDKIYKNCHGAIRLMEFMFNIGLRTAAIFDLENGIYVNNSRDLNVNIILYKNKLYLKIVKFLNENSYDSYVNEIYDNKGNINALYNKAMRDMEKYLNEGDFSINDLYANSFGSDADNTLLEAIYAYTILRYFDTMINNTIDKFVSYDSAYINRDIPLSYNKYLFLRGDDHLRKNFREPEARTSIQNTSRFSKFILNTIPLEIRGISTNTAIGTVLLNVTFGKIFSNISKMFGNNTSAIKNIRNSILSFSESPVTNAINIITSIATNTDLQNWLKANINAFNDRDIGVIESLYKYVYSLDDDINSYKPYSSFLHKSIRALEFSKMRDNLILGRYSIVEDISGVINDCMAVTYLYSEFSNDGLLKVELRDTIKDRRFSEKFKDTVNNINIHRTLSKRKELSESMVIDKTTSLLNIKVTIPIEGMPKIVFNMQSNNILGILGQTLDVKMNFSDNPEELLLMMRILNIFESDDIIDLSNEAFINRILYNDDLSEDEILFKKVLSIIDERLNTKFLSEDGLRRFNIYKNLNIYKNNENYIIDLLRYAVKSQLVSDIYYKYHEEKSDNTSFYSYLVNEYTAFLNLTQELKNIYFIRRDGSYYLRTLPSSTLWVDDYSTAEAILTGLEVRSTSKNLQGNNDANYVTSFLGGKIHSLVYEAQRAAQLRRKLKESNPNLPNTASGSLLFVNDPSLISKVVINSDIKTRGGKVKRIRDLTASSLIHNAFMNNFWSRYISKDSDYSILPTTYSDKVKIIQYLVKSDKYNINWKHLRDGHANVAMSTLVRNATDEFKNRIIQEWADTIGVASLNALNNVIYDYLQLWGENLTLDLINERLRSYNEDTLIREANEKNIKLALDLHYRIKHSNGKEFLSVNELLVHEARQADPEYVRQLFERERLNFVKDVVNSRVSFFTEYLDTTLNSREKLKGKKLLEQSNTPLAKVILELYSTDAAILEYLNEWTSNNKLIVAKDTKKNPIVYQDGVEVGEMNPLFEIFFYAESLLSNNLRLLLTGFETNHPDKSKFSKIWDSKAFGINNDLLASKNNISMLLKSNIIFVPYNIHDYNSTKIINMDRDPSLTIEAAMQEASKTGKKILTSNPFFLSSCDIILTIDLATHDKTINIGDLNISDIVALADDYDLYALSQSTNELVRNLANSIIDVVLNIAQGTQLKRNVIIPATLHNMNKNYLDGPAPKINVAVIQDVQADVYNFTGDTSKVDTMDGSAFVTIEQSILENKTLNSQEVGIDKKPIWYNYDHNTGTSKLVKFASYEINNERMLLSMNSTIPLEKIYKKMTNIQWANFDENGDVISWNTSEPINLGTTVNIVGGAMGKRSSRKIDFSTIVPVDAHLYYKTYDNDRNIIYKEIIGFGRDEDGYYTEEKLINNPEIQRVHHYFSGNSEHHTVKLAGDHTINSIYELWLSLGGLYSVNIDADNNIIPSESSHYAVANFINSTLNIQKSGNNLKSNSKHILTQDYYELPLKTMFIGYLINNTAMKNGAVNRNSVDRWYDDEALSYFLMDSNGLGVLMDAEYDLDEELDITEPSQMINALESGGYLHNRVKLVYQDLGLIAVKASKLELDAVISFLLDSDHDYNRVKSILYDVIGRTLLNKVNKRSNLTSLTDDILRAIEARFNRNVDHLYDIFKIPFSDPNVYSLILPIIVSNINLKSIKRPYPGSRDVLVPGYNMMLYFKIDGMQYMAEDLLRKALNHFKNTELPLIEDQTLFERTVILMYLNELLSDPKYLKNDVDEFMPTDVVDVMNNDTVIKTIRLDALEDYYNFKDKNWAYFNISPEDITHFRYNITSPKNLAPVQITFTRSDNNKQMNVFDLEPFRLSYEDPSKLNRMAVKLAFIDLDKGFIRENGRVIQILDLHIEAAEAINSNMYGNLFDLKGKTVSQILEEGAEFFMNHYVTPIPSSNYLISFNKTNGKNTYISFDSPKGDGYHTYMPYDDSKLYTEAVTDGKGNLHLDVWLISSENKKLFRVGRYIIKDGYSYRDRHFYDDNDKIVELKVSKNLKAEGNLVYEYVEFVSKYNVEEKDANGSILLIDKYYININHIDKAFTQNAKSDRLLRNQFITSLVEGIYGSDTYSDIIINPTLSYTDASNIRHYVYHMRNIDEDFRQAVLNPLCQQLEEIMDSFLGKEVTLDLEQYYNKFYRKAAESKFNSWKQSLYFISTRIPTLALQSFMLMKTVAYTGNSRNVIHVSHWQTWLQGSDYDIDESYMMGLSFGNNGKIISWSNLFDTSTELRLEASMKLPVPRNLFIRTDGSGETFDINPYLFKIVRINDSAIEDKKAAILLEVSDLLTDLYSNTQSTNISFTYDEGYKELAEDIINNYIIVHERTKLSASLEEDAYKNSVAANIRTVIQDLRNMSSAYSPVIVSDLGELAENSEKGNLIANMSLMNPTTKLLMLLLNMVGKGVIGISAVGEKTFFTLSYYYNEGIRSYNLDHIKNMLFSKTFDRIQGRYSGNPKTVTKTTLANINLENIDITRLFLLSLSEEDNELRELYGITDNDIIDKTEKWFQYRNELINLARKKKEELDDMPEVDLMISQILSAATDNAKELILSKINCDTNLAKFHLYLLMLGFDIKDVVSFMTSPCVELVSNFVDINNQDPYINDSNVFAPVRYAINLADGIINTSPFFSGSINTTNEEGLTESYQRATVVYNFLRNSSTARTLLENFGIEKFEGLLDLIQKFIKARVADDSFKTTLKEMAGDVFDYELNKQLRVLSSYVEGVIYSIKKYQNKYSDKSDYLKDLDELSNIETLANEVTTLGVVFLSFNQGLPTSKIDLSTKMSRIKKAVTDREKLFGINDIDLQDAGDREELVSKLLDNNKFLSEDEVLDTLNLAYAYNIINNFDIESWILDKDLNYDELLKYLELLNKQDIKIVNRPLLNTEIPNISYRLLVIRYYNIIKGTFNIFDVVERSPLYRAILDLFKAEYIIDKETGIKSRIFNLINLKVFDEYNFVDDSLKRLLIKYINDLLINSYFSNREFLFPIYEGTEYLDNEYRTTIALSDRMIDLNTSVGRASFKKVFESIITQLQDTGTYGDITINNYSSNKFLQDISITYDNYDVPSLVPELDLMQISLSQYSIKTYQLYIDGLTDLLGYYINGISLADWFIIYNLFVNLNLYGSDRFTSIFKNQVINRKSILEDYFKYISELDYAKTDLELLDNIGYNAEDALIRIAPFVPRSQRRGNKAPYIRTTTSTGEYIVEQRMNGVYSRLEPPYLLTTQQVSNYKQYQSIPLWNHDFVININAALRSGNIDNLVQSLKTQTTNGTLVITYENC